jgi:hypothetical protein
MNALSRLLLMFAVSVSCAAPGAFAAGVPTLPIGAAAPDFSLPGVEFLGI